MIDTAYVQIKLIEETEDTDMLYKIYHKICLKTNIIIK